MKLIKWLFISITLILFLLIGTAFIIPYFFKDDLIKIVKKEMNDQLNANVDFNNNIGITLFRSFPDLSIHLSDIKVIGKDEFEGLQLAKIKDLDVNLDLRSVLQSNTPTVNSFTVDNATVYVKILKNGKANYDIIKPSESSKSSSSDYEVKLENYALTNSKITYDDESSSTWMEVVNLNHSGSGNFTSNIFDLITKSKADKLTVSNNGITYINKAKADIDLTLNVDNKSSKYTFKDNKIKLNALTLNTKGFVQPKGDDINLDLDFRAPQTDFKYLLSMIPSAYTKNFDNVNASGKMKFRGDVKGKYNKTSMPAFNVLLEVDEGTFKYPDLPFGVKDINTKMTINSPSADLDRMVVNIPTFHFKLGPNPVDGSFILRTPMSDPNIDTKFIGKIDLESLAKAFPLEGIKELTGLIDANLDIDTKMSFVENKQYDRIDMKGDFKMTDIDYVAEGMPPVKVKEMEMAFTPKHVRVDRAWVKLGKSDIKADGTLDNALAYFSPNLTMKGDLNIRSDYFDTNEWLEDQDPEDPTANYKPQEENKEQFERFDFDINANFKKIDYETYTLNNTTAKGNFTPQQAIIDQFKTEIGDTDIAATGQLDNVYDYLYRNQALEGDITMNSKRVNLNELASEEETTSSSDELTSPIPVPENININLLTNIDELIYDNLNIKDLKGRLLVKNEKLDFNDLVGSMMGGQFKFNGFYDTKNKKDNPAFDIVYDMYKMDFKESFNTLNTVQQIAPIAKFIEGLYSSEIKLSGNLKKDMSVDYNTISGDGILNTINAVIRNFKPLTEIGKIMNIKELNDFEITDTKNWFELTNGKVIVKPFDWLKDGMAISGKGSHGITTEAMDYQLQFTIPREKLEQSSVGKAANTGIGLLTEQANKLGLNIKQGDNIKFLAFVKGSITKPKVSIKFLGTSDKTLKEEVTDQATEIVEKEVEKAKDNAQVVVDEQVDKASEKVNEEVDKVVDKTTEVIVDKVGGVVGDTLKGIIDKTVGDKVGDVIGDKAKDELDKLKDKIKIPKIGGKKKNKED